MDLKIPQGQLLKWLKGIDTYENRLVEDWEEDHIRQRVKDLKKIDGIFVVEGDWKTQLISDIIIDITVLKPEGFHPGKNVTMTLAHFIRPCPCDDCDHENQYECYLNDCECCSGSCT